MWFFKRKKRPAIKGTLPLCPWCGGENTRPVFYNGTESENVKVWRGQRSAAFRCADCGRDFYAGELRDVVVELNDLPVIEDEDALRDAEEKLKREIDEGGDRRFPR